MNQMLPACRGGQPFSAACSKAVLLSPRGNATWLAEGPREKESFHHSTRYENEKPSIVLLFPESQAELRLILLAIELARADLTESDQSWQLWDTGISPLGALSFLSSSGRMHSVWLGLWPDSYDFAK